MLYPLDAVIVCTCRIAEDQGKGVKRRRTMLVMMMKFLVSVQSLPRRSGTHAEGSGVVRPARLHLFRVQRFVRHSSNWIRTEPRQTRGERAKLLVLS